MTARGGAAGARRDDAAARLDAARHAIRAAAQCGECGRVFDLLDEDDANEWFYGHDCEGTG